MLPTIRVAASAEELALLAAERVAEAAESAIAATGRFSIALSGGSTPQALYRLLASVYVDKLPWEKTHVLFADERCVPASDPQSNFGMACKLLLDHVPISYDNVHRMVGEKDPQAAAEEYNLLLQKSFPKGVDLALLGMGDDGHTASLFPGSAALGATGSACVANYVEKLGAWRLTLTAEYLNKAFDVLVMVAGKSKAPAVQAALYGSAPAAECPIRLIEPASGRMVWLMDAEAAGMDAEDDDEETPDLLDDEEALEEEEDDEERSGG